MFKNKTRRCAAALLCGAAVAAALCFLPKPLLIKKSGVDRITLVLGSHICTNLLTGALAPPYYTAVITNRHDVVSILAVLSTGKRTEEHLCLYDVTLTIKYSAGPEVPLGLLPGHDPQWYEFRGFGDIWRVERSEWFRALDAAGVNTNELTEEGYLRRINKP